jgi:aerobic C4-dicarboxylate transport protein
VIPNTIVDAFARGEILQVLLASLLPGPATLSLGNRVRPLVGLIKQA